MQDVEYRAVGSLANTDSVMKNLFWLGVYPGMDENAIDYMVESFMGIIRT